MSADPSSIIFKKRGTINTAYSLFYTYNYTGTESISSYALPFASFIFVPTLRDVTNRLSNKRIIWDFGDGTTSEAVTARHAYKEPGSYKVSCYLYDSSGTSYYDSYSINVNVYNFVPDSILIESDLSTTTALTAGRYTNPISVIRSTSYQTALKNPSPTIVAYASGANIVDFFNDNIGSKHYGHLYPYTSFYKLEENYANINEFVELSSFKTPSQDIFCKLHNNEIIVCNKTDRDAFFCGTSGREDVYFKSDIPVDNINLLFGFETGDIVQDCNTTTVGLSARVIPNTSYNNLAITSNGIDSEGDSSETVFNLNSNKFSNTEIGIVVTVKDRDNFTNKGFVLSSVDLKLTDGTNIFPITVTSNNIDVEDIQSPSFFKGSIQVNSNNLLSNVFLTVSGNVIDNNTSIPLTGVSTTFNIYPSGGYYNIAKKGEYIDMAERFKEISVQPLFIDLRVLYDDFISGIFGTLSSDQTSIGKLTYEKIQNFVSNNTITDYANIDKLISLFEQYGTDDLRFSTTNYRFPAGMARLVDLLSIKKTKLFGVRNTFSENFNSRGYVNHSDYGTNLGEEITVNTTLSAGDSIVAYERFSGNYSVLNTFLPGLSSYTVSQYQDSWGWNLLLPENGYGEAISNYYFFYRFIPTLNGDISDGVIDFTDPNTTISFDLSSYEDWSKKDGVISNILAHQLYKGLNLIK